MYKLNLLRGHIPTGKCETLPILKKLSQASRSLAELKGLAASIPRQGILINTLAMQEAKDSSDVESIVTTHDELFQGDTAVDTPANPATKEVIRYTHALKVGYDYVREMGLLTANHIAAIQKELVQNTAGFRTQLGTTLKNPATGETVYAPPQNQDEIMDLMTDLEWFINTPDATDLDPLVKMAIIHHQFESIHPFYDGNGRTGRIVNVLYLVKEGLLDIPILYLSRYIVRNKPDYYRLLQKVRDDGDWESWILYILEGVEQTARSAIDIIGKIKEALLLYKHQIRTNHKFYSQDLINNLFTHPYTKIAFLQQDLGVTRLTATKYLDALAADGLLEKQRIGRSNYYTNKALYKILTSESMGGNRE